MTKDQHDSEARTEGQQVITACAFIHQKFDGIDKVFLGKRAATKKLLPGVFELPGGHIDFAEDIVTGLRREITEELGASIEVGDPFSAFDYKNDIKGSHSIEVIYFARFVSDIKKIELNPADHSEFGWFAESELTKVYSPQKGADDPEFKAIKTGFRLLAGGSINF